MWINTWVFDSQLYILHGNTVSVFLREMPSNTLTLVICSVEIHSILKMYYNINTCIAISKWLSRSCDSQSVFSVFTCVSCQSLSETLRVDDEAVSNSILYRPRKIKYVKSSKVNAITISIYKWKWGTWE